MRVSLSALVGVDDMAVRRRGGGASAGWRCEGGVATDGANGNIVEYAADYRRFPGVSHKKLEINW